MPLDRIDDVQSPDLKTGTNEKKNTELADLSYCVKSFVTLDYYYWSVCASPIALIHTIAYAGQSARKP